MLRFQPPALNPSLSASLAGDVSEEVPAPPSNDRPSTSQAPQETVSPQEFSISDSEESSPGGALVPVETPGYVSPNLGSGMQSHPHQPRPDSMRDSDPGEEEPF